MLLAGTTVVYGGSFNPPHVGHQMTCLYLLEALGAEAVWLMPVYRHPFNKDLAPFAARVTMCQCLSAPFGERVQVSQVESEPGMTGRTFDTLTTLVAQFPERRFALAVGADILQEAPSWYRWADLERLVPVVVLARPGYPNARGSAVAMPQVSSTEIRRRLAAGESIEGTVPLAVAQFIRSTTLYA